MTLFASLIFFSIFAKTLWTPFRAQSYKCWGLGKSTYTFSAEQQQLSVFHFPPNYMFRVEPAGGGERKVESRRRSAENVYVDLP
jgi:hypothetical protein